MLNTKIKNTIIESLLNTKYTDLEINLKSIINQYKLSLNYKIKLMSATKGYINSSIYDIEFRLQNDYIVSVIPRIYLDEELRKNTVKLKDLKITIIGITKDIFIPVPDGSWESKSSRISKNTVYFHYKNYTTNELTKLIAFVKSKSYDTIYFGFDKTVNTKVLTDLIPKKEEECK